MTEKNKLNAPLTWQIPLVQKLSLPLYQEHVLLLKNLEHFHAMLVIIAQYYKAYIPSHFQYIPCLFQGRMQINVAFTSSPWSVIGGKIMKGKTLLYLSPSMEFCYKEMEQRY